MCVIVVYESVSFHQCEKMNLTITVTASTVCVKYAEDAGKAKDV